MAFYLPSIPILIISGQLEKALDAWVGPVKSMAIRLNVGLAGCTACCAAFPFLPTTHTTLLWLVAVLGMVSDDLQEPMHFSRTNQLQEQAIVAAQHISPCRAQLDTHCSCGEWFVT